MRVSRCAFIRLSATDVTCVCVCVNFCHCTHIYSNRRKIMTLLCACGALQVHINVQTHSIRAVLVHKILITCARACDWLDTADGWSQRANQSMTNWLTVREKRYDAAAFEYDPYWTWWCVSAWLWLCVINKLPAQIVTNSPQVFWHAAVCPKVTAFVIYIYLCLLVHNYETPGNALSNTYTHTHTDLSGTVAVSVAAD